MQGADTVRWWAEGYDSETLPLDDYQHIEMMIDDGYREGELILGEAQCRGWWTLLD